MYDKLIALKHLKNSSKKYETQIKARNNKCSLEKLKLKKMRYKNFKSNLWRQKCQCFWIT